MKQKSWLIKTFAGIICLIAVLAMGVAGKLSTGSEDKGLIPIPAGEFLMGTDDPNLPFNHQPMQSVNLDAYMIGACEVTNSEFEQFVIDGGYQRKELWLPNGWAFIQEHKIQIPYSWRNSEFRQPSQPVTGVSWYEANAFAGWAGKRLPTEAEWEKAARGEAGYHFPWGNTFDFRCVNYSAFTLPLPVGSFPDGQSPYGVFDMAGNVAEWVMITEDDSDCSEFKSFKVVKGGAWSSIRSEFRCANRRYEKPTWRGLDVGFRLATSSPGTDTSEENATMGASKGVAP